MKPALPVTLRERKVVIGLIWFWSFTLYSFLGFLLETAYSRAVGGREDRKTLWVLPLCPVYGLGACAILLLPESVRRQLPLLFVFGGLIATTVEYGMAVIYERGLGVSFWDYTGMPGNVQGRVCLPFSMAWGVLAVVLVRWLHPAVVPWLAGLPVPLSWLALTTVLTDLVLSSVLLKKTGDRERLKWYG